MATWKTGGANVAGTAGVAFGTDGTVYVAIGARPRRRGRTPSTNGHGAAGATPNAVVALDRSTLEVKDWFTADGADFNTSPVVIRHKDKDLIAATGNDGRLYLLDGAVARRRRSQDAAARQPKYTAPAPAARWRRGRTSGARWRRSSTLAAARRSRHALRSPAPRARAAASSRSSSSDEGGKLALEPGWQSRDLVSPLAPIVVNGMVFAASSGEYRPPEGAATAAPTLAQRAQRSLPAVLYVLDGATGKELWTSGRPSRRSRAPGSRPAAARSIS